MNTRSTSTWRWVWSSSGIRALEEEFDVSFEVAEIEAMTSFVDIVSTVESKL